MSKKRYLSYLTALSILFSQGIPFITKAETNTDTNYEITSEDYELTKYSGIFDMSEEEKTKLIDNLGELYFIEAKLEKGTIVIPAKLSFKKTIDDSEKDTDENKRFIERGRAILLSDFKEICFVPESFDSKSKDLIFYTDLFSEETILIEDTSNEEKFANDNYFKENFNQNSISAKSIKALNIELALGYYKNALFENNSMGIGPHLYGKPQTFEKIFEIYKQVVPFEYWPVILKKDKNINQFQNINSTLPKLNEETLAENLENVRLVLIENGEEMKYVISVIYDQNGVRDLKDIFTNEFMGRPKFNKEYLTNIGFKNTKIETFIIKSSSLNSDFPNNIVKNEKLNGLDLARHFKDLKNVKDLMEAYQTLPLEYQVDYSYFDFTNNPNVVQPDKSSTVISPKGNFVADLDNMTLTPISNKPKIKELTRNS